MAEFIIRNRVLTKYNGCKKVVHIPYGVTEIGQSAFMDHNEIANVTLPDSITGIGVNAFLGCDAMKSINIPQGVRKIDDNAFLRCESLEKIVIPDSVTGLGMWCFSECGSLRTVSIPESIRNIGALAFYHTKWLDEYPGDFVTVNGILICYKGNDTTVEIPAGVKKIASQAFNECKNVEKICIPSSVKRICKNAFTSCEALHTLEISGSANVPKSAFDDCGEFAVTAV